MKLSLIQTSINRKEELSRFVDSLNSQINIDFSSVEYIFVDQGDNKFIFDNLHYLIDFKYIKIEPCSLSHARNVALPYVRGQYVGFPDDDCWYEPDTLSKVLKIFDGNIYQGVSGIGKNETGELTSVFLKHSAEINYSNYFSAISYTLFFRFIPDVYFDERIGVGSAYNLGAGEETDYMLRLMELHSYKILFEPSIVVHHPTNLLNDPQKKLKKVYSYARGTGFLLQKHHFSKCYILKQLLRPLFGILIFALSVNMFRMKKAYYNLRGKIEGLMYKFK